MEFCEMLESVEVLLKAGNSIENALKKVQKELVHIQGQDSYMMRELKQINTCINIDVSTENAIKDFASRADIPEISNFAEVFIISKRSEGNIIKVIHNVCNSIRDNVNIHRQIRMSLSGVVQEINIMRIMPLIILIYLKVFSKGYYDCVHQTIIGQCSMGIILVAYMIACTLISHMQRKVLYE
jgi:tight adherence protein B